MQYECDYNTRCGKDIRPNGDTFIGVNIWDIDKADSTSISSNISMQALGTIIVEKIMTYQLFTDDGINTKILD